MKSVSNEDYRQIIRALRWASVQGDDSTRSREWRRKVARLCRKLERKNP